MKETLEEAAVRLVKETTLYGKQEASIGSSARSYFETELRCILLGAKWQKEQDKNKYSEEEVKHIVSEALQSALVKFDLEQWFKQFKKK